MRRREFIARLGAAGAYAAVPRLALAQQGTRVRRVGVLTFGTDTEPLTSLTTKLLREELQKLGWIEGRNLRIDFRFGFGDATKTRVFAADLVQLAPDVIVARMEWRSAPCSSRRRRFRSYSSGPAIPSKAGR